VLEAFSADICVREDRLRRSLAFGFTAPPVVTGRVKPDPFLRAKFFRQPNIDEIAGEKISDRPWKTITLRF